MNKYPYFKTSALCIDGSPPPPPLAFTVQRKIRFEEVDPLSIVWHGRYPSYFEDARVAFGEQFGIGYLDMYREAVAAPIKNMYIDYLQPLKFGETCFITASLYWSEAARINFAYEMTNERKERVTTGYTVQLFLTPQGELYMEQPDFFAKFCEKWKAGAFS